MGLIAFLTDRSPGEALPALDALDEHGVKALPLAEDSVANLPDLAPAVILVDGKQDAPAAHRLLVLLGSTIRRVPVVALVAPADLEALPWEEVADDFVHPETPAPELRVRLAMATGRSGGAGEDVVRLGPLSIGTETYRVAAGGRVLDLTYKEFQLLRFLVQRPGRVFSRAELLQEVWGFNFYGGTRTVDVHVRRLRAKLGAEHESMIQTVRGVGYRAADPGGQEAMTSAPRHHRTG